MLAFSQIPAHNEPVMLKPITRVMNPGQSNQKIITIRPGELNAMLVCGDKTYWLVPANLPDELALMTVLKEETIETYFMIVNMLREMAA